MNPVPRPADQRRPRFLPALALLALAGLLVPVTRAAADDNLNTEMSEVAKQVKQFLDGKHEKSVSIGHYTCPKDVPSSSGPAIASALGAELKALGVHVEAGDTNYIVDGDYKYVEDGRSKDQLHAVAIETEIVNRKGEVLVSVHQMGPRGVYGDAAQVSLLGVSADLPPDADVKARDDKVDNAYEHPKPHVDHTRIQAGNSPYAIEILVKSGDGHFTPCAPVEKDGLSYVELKKDDVYRVRVYNDSPYEAAVVLTIDGLNMFCFSEVKDPHSGKPLYDRMMVRSKKSFDVPGWHRNDGNHGSDEFLVTKYADSEAAKMYADSSNIGTITVSFAAAWPKNGSPPPDEPAEPHAYSRSADLGTTRGAAVGAGYTPVERQFGVVRAAVSVRYSK